jgi:hypothetical protein
LFGNLARRPPSLVRFAASRHRRRVANARDETRSALPVCFGLAQLPSLTALRVSRERVAIRERTYHLPRCRASGARLALHAVADRRHMSKKKSKRLQWRGRLHCRLPFAFVCGDHDGRLPIAKVQELVWLG